MTSSPIDVVILSWNDGRLLEAAVQSVLASHNVEANIIVVDNGSEPRVALSQREHVTVIRNDKNVGVARGRNQGACRGGAEFLCLLDSDAAVEPDALSTMISLLRSESSLAVVGPVYVGQLPEESAGRAPSVWTKMSRLLNRKSTYAGVSSSAPWWDVDFTIGACQVIRRSCWDTVGGLDESYFYGPEDVDFCLRLKERGWRIAQVAGALVHHPPRRRHRGVFTRKGVLHARAVVKHLWRHRKFRSDIRG